MGTLNLGIKYSQALLMLAQMAWFLLRAEGEVGIPSNPSVCFSPPSTGSLLRLHHYPHGADVVYRGPAPGYHCLVPHRPLPPDGYHGCL